MWGHEDSNLCLAGPTGDAQRLYMLTMCPNPAYAQAHLSHSRAHETTHMQTLVHPQACPTDLDSSPQASQSPLTLVLVHVQPHTTQVTAAQRVEQRVCVARRGGEGAQGPAVCCANWIHKGWMLKGLLLDGTLHGLQQGLARGVQETLP